MNKAKVISSLIYKFIERFSVKGIGLVISVVMARLLAPEVFGQVAILNVFIGLSQTLVESGLNTALVQSPEVSERDYSTVFYISMAISAVLVALLCACAPLIADFYESPEIITPLRFYSLSMLFMALSSILSAKIQRELRFKQQLRCSLAATLISGAAGILMAQRGAGIWALIVYYFAHSVVYCAAMFAEIRWLPKSRFSLESAKRLYAFGFRMLASSMLTTLYNNLRPLIIGKKFSTADLGYYDKGSQFSTIISLNIDSAVQSVMFPVFSTLQDDSGKIRAAMRRSMSVSAMVIFPVMLGFAAVSEPLVRLLLTDKWLPSVFFIQVLCVGEMQVPITSSNLVVLKSLGRSEVYMRQELVRRTAMLVVLAISVFVFRSVEAIACGFTLSAWIDAFITSRPLRRLIGYGFKEELRDVWKNLIAALLMAGAVYALNALALPLIAKLALQVLSGAVIYMLLCWALRAESFLYALNMLKKMRHREAESDGK